MKVVICIPVYGDTRAGFTQSLAGLVYRSARDGIELQTAMASGSILPVNREKLVEAARRAGASHILFLDADHTFPEDSLLRLLGHGLDVVGCNYILRRDPQSPSAFRNGQPVSSASRTGVEQVDLLGLGICLVALSVFDRLTPPYFRYALIDRGQGVELVGEDVGFFNALLGAGIPVHVDHDLSRDVGHIAETVLTFPAWP